MRTARTVAWIAAVLAGMGASAQQQDFSQVAIETQKLAEGVYMLKGAGGNIGVCAGGKSLEQAMADRPTQDLDATWGKGFFKPDSIVQMVYLDLKRTVK
jgi:hypothetical protein